MDSEDTQDKLKVHVLSAIYFDACVLRGLPGTIHSPAFLALREAAQKLKISLYIPKVVIEELIELRKSRIEKGIRQIKEGQKEVVMLLGANPFGDEKPTDVAAAAVQLVREELSQVNIVEVPTSLVSKEELLEMAIKKCGPFRDKDKGFKDAVIMFSVIEHMKSNSIGHSVLVTEDKVFDSEEVKKVFLDSGLEVKAAKRFDEASEYINETSMSFLIEVSDDFSQRVRPFLEEKKDEIFKYVLDNGEVSDWFIRDFFKEVPEISEQTDIVAVGPARPFSLGKIFPFHLPFHGQVAKVRGDPFTFYVATKFDVVVKELSLASMFPRPMIQLSKATTLADLRHPTAVYDEKIINVTKEIAVEAGIVMQDGVPKELIFSRVLSY